MNVTEVDSAPNSFRRHNVLVHTHYTICYIVKHNRTQNIHIGILITHQTYTSVSTYTCAHTSLRRRVLVHMCMCVQLYIPRVHINCSRWVEYTKTASCVTHSYTSVSATNPCCSTVHLFHNSRSFAERILTRFVPGELLNTPFWRLHNPPPHAFRAVTYTLWPQVFSGHVTKSLQVTSPIYVWC